MRFCLVSVFFAQFLFEFVSWSQTPVSFSFAGAGLSSPEGSHVCGVVRREGPVDDSFVLAWRIIPFTARVDEDFAGPLTGTLTIPSGQSLTCLPVQLLNDGLVEPTKSFTLQLVSASGQATIGSFSNFWIEVRDNDVGLEFAAAEFTVLETAPEAVVTVRRGDDGSNAVTVGYETIPRDANAALDYQPKTGTVVFPHGKMDATFRISIHDDCFLESTETLGVRLVSPTDGAVFATRSNAVIRIVDAGQERPGSLDLGYQPLTRGAEVLVARPDGRILVGGVILDVADRPLPLVMQLLPDGSPDPSFNPVPLGETLVGSSKPQISAMAVAGDGTVVVAGFGRRPKPGSSGMVDFNFLNRVLPTGAVDTSFQPGLIASGASSAAFLSMAVQADGRILVGGEARLMGSALVRLHPDGSLDDAFQLLVTNVVRNAGTRVTAINQLPDGRVVIGGAFTHVQGTRRDGVARLFASGDLDPSFSSGCDHCDLFGIESQTPVESMAIAANGQVWISGSFTNIGLEQHRGLALLSPNGVPNRSINFGSGGNNGVGPPPYRHVALQWDGKLLISGRFTNFSGVPANALVRLNPDGSVDGSFQPDMSKWPRAGPWGFAGQWCNAILVQQDGNILVSRDVHGESWLYGEPVLVRYVSRVYAEPTLSLSAFEDPIFAFQVVRLSTRPGATYRLERSADFRRWAPVETNTAFDCSLDFVLPYSPPLNSGLFYRAVRIGL